MTRNKTGAGPGLIIGTRNDWDWDQSLGPEMTRNWTRNGPGPGPGTGSGPKKFSGQHV